MPKRPAILIGFIVLIYIAARLWRLTDSCLWFDEIFGIHAAEHAWPDLIAFVAKDLIHPPLFYLLLKLWIAAGGESPLWLRLFPVVFSVLALIPLWMLCRELKLRSTTIIVAFGLFAVNGALIKYAQEVRMYSLLLFLSLVSIWLFSRFFFRGKSFWMLVLANVFLVYSHYFGWFVVGAEVVAIAVAQRIKILQTLLMVGVTAAAFVPWIFAVFRFAEPESSVTQNIGWMQRPGIRALLDFAFDLVDPFYFQQSSIDKTANFVIAIPLVLISAAAVIVYFVVKFRDDEHKDRLIFLTIFSVFPLLLAFALSWLLPVSVWGSRHLLIVFAPAIILVSIFLTEIKPELLSLSLIAAIFVLATVAFILQLSTPQHLRIWCAWESLAGKWVLAPQRSSEPARLYVFEDLVAYDYWFATRQIANREIVLLKGVEGMPNDPAYFLPRGFDGVAVSELPRIEGEEIWLSFRKASRPAPVGEHERSIRPFDVPITNFENLGYVVEDVKRQIYGTQTAYLIRMRKAPPPSARPVP